MSPGPKCENLAHKHNKHDAKKSLTTNYTNIRLAIKAESTNIIGSPTAVTTLQLLQQTDDQEMVITLFNLVKPKQSRFGERKKKKSNYLPTGKTLTIPFIPFVTNGKEWNRMLLQKK